MVDFSGAVKIGDVNDFITPSQACILNIDDASKARSQDIPTNGLVSGFKQTVTDEKTSAIKVTLQDCLACSGCVTTAETILLEHQSVDEVLAKLETKSNPVVVSLSPQSIASLAVAHGIPVKECAEKLCGFLKDIGVDRVLHLHTARSIALSHCASDLIHRIRYHRTQALKNAPCENEELARSSAQTCCKWGSPIDLNPANQESHTHNLQLPMLISACPGWVCYAEKTHGKWLLPHLSTAKSPQAVAGSLIKLSEGASAEPADTNTSSGTGTNNSASVFHVSIMPCYDKKLEAARPDLTTRVGSGQNGSPGDVPDTDIVLTTTEIQDLLFKKNVSLVEIQPRQLDDWRAFLGLSGSPCQRAALETSTERNSRRSGNAPHQSVALTPKGISSARSDGSCGCVDGKHQRSDSHAAMLQGVRGGSGGYLEYTVKHAALRLFGLDLGEEPLEMKKMRNSDFEEVHITCQGETVLSAAKVYGFRHIQNLVRKIKARSCRYDVVEVMACPSGCLNGGGQVKPEGGQAVLKSRLSDVDTAYHDPESMELNWPGEDAAAAQVAGVGRSRTSPHNFIQNQVLYGSQKAGLDTVLEPHCHDLSDIQGRKDTRVEAMCL